MPSALPKPRTRKNTAKSALAQYYADVMRIPIPSRQKYTQLFKEYKRTRNPAKKIELKKRIAEGVLPFIAQIARKEYGKVAHLTGKIVSPSISLEDVIQSANEQLLTHVIDYHMPNKGAFTTYVEESIRNHVRTMIRREWPYHTLPFAIEERRRDVGLFQKFEREHRRIPKSSEELRAFARKSGIKNP